MTDGADGIVEVANVDAAVPAAGASALERPIPPLPAGDWGNYVQAACAGAARRRTVLACDGATLPRATATYPARRRRSSSSALVVACALASRRSAGARPRGRPASSAELLARGEQLRRHARAAAWTRPRSCSRRPGHALRLDFFPLRARRCRRSPAAPTFVVAHSLDEAAKSGARARASTTSASIECRLACAVLARAAGIRSSGSATLSDPAAVRDALDDLLPAACLREQLTARLGLERAEVGAPGSAVRRAGRSGPLRAARARASRARGGGACRAGGARAARRRPAGTGLPARRVATRAQPPTTAPARRRPMRWSRSARASGALGRAAHGRGLRRRGAAAGRARRARDGCSALDERLYALHARCDRRALHRGAVGRREAPRASTARDAVC